MMQIYLLLILLILVNCEKLSSKSDWSVTFASTGYSVPNDKARYDMNFPGDIGSPNTEEYYDCCSKALSGTSHGCITPNTVDNITYYCVTVYSECSSCQLKANLSSSSCYRCCVEDDDTVCEDDYSYISTSSWSKNCISCLDLLTLTII